MMALLVWLLCGCHCMAQHSCCCAAALVTLGRRWPSVMWRLCFLRYGYGWYSILYCIVDAGHVHVPHLSLSGVASAVVGVVLLSWGSSEQCRAASSVVWCTATPSSIVDYYIVMVGRAACRVELCDCWFITDYSIDVNFLLAIVSAAGCRAVSCLDFCCFIAWCHWFDFCFKSVASLKGAKMASKMAVSGPKG
jgi:hypothetical protein